MSHSFSAQIPHDEGVKLRVDLDTVLFLLLVLIIFYIRVVNLNYNTLFVDEAIYATVGNNVLSNVLSQNATSWMYGSYLYPIMAANVSYLTGDVSGLRGLSAILSTLTAVFVYLSTARLFNKSAGLWAMMLFGLTSISLDIGQYAVYDAPAVALLAITLYCLIKAPAVSPTKESIYLLMAASSFILAILSKYFVGLYLPTLIVIGLACYLFRRRSNYGLFTTFVAPMGLILGLYAYFYRHDLLILFSSDFGVQAGARGQIFEDIWAELGVATILAVVGAYFAIWKFFSQPVSRSKRERLIWILLIPCLAIFFFAAPLYHLVTANQHVAWKHTIYSLVFLSPLAGFGCASVVAQIRSYQGRRVVLFRLLGAALMIVGMIWFVDYSLDRNWSFQNNWPNVSHVITYLNEHGLSKEDRVLAEGAHIYEYYFDFGPAYHSVWQDTWFMAYDGLDGTSAMAAAIQDRWFDYVVLDDYYTPGMRQMLAPALSEAGYVIGYEETQKLGTGQNILIQVYTLAN